MIERDRQTGRDRDIERHRDKQTECKTDRHTEQRASGTRTVKTSFRFWLEVTTSSGGLGQCCSSVSTSNFLQVYSTNFLFVLLVIFCCEIVTIMVRGTYEHMGPIEYM